MRSLTSDASKPRRQLGLFDAIMIVMGGIVGAGIFANPSEVAHRVHTPFLILGVWVLGGFIAMCGAFIWAELATRLPGTGGQYLYLREAYHPSVAFVYGWGLLLVTQTGGMAAVAVIFSSYFRALTGVAWNDSVIAAAVLLILTGINCLGARAGSNVQSALMLLKIGALAALVTLGFAFGGGSLKSGPLLGQPASLGLLKDIGSAMVPIAFAYGGWQTATFVAGEMRDARRDLSRGLLLGVAAVVALYLAVNLACLRVLGPAGLDATTTPASDVMRIALGERGAQWIAAGIAISTLGFLSQSMLTAPRVYYAMARDGLFFESVGKLSPRSGAPVVAIVLQGSGRNRHRLFWDVWRDFELCNYCRLHFLWSDGGVALRLTAASGGIRQRHLPRAGTPVYYDLFVLSCAGIVGSAIVASPANSAIALCIMLAALPVYYYWSRFRRAHS